MIDFGLAKRFLEYYTGKHIPFRENAGHVGTARYMPKAAHQGNEQCRRDDLESLGYNILYLLRGGNLPWAGLAFDGEKKVEKFERIYELKCKLTPEDLCKDFTPALKGLEEPMMKYMRTVEAMSFEEEPDYQKLRSFFKDVAK